MSGNVLCRKYIRTAISTTAPDPPQLPRLGGTPNGVASSCLSRPATYVFTASRICSFALGSRYGNARTAVQPRKPICSGVIICGNNSFRRDLYGSAPCVAIVNSRAAGQSMPTPKPRGPKLAAGAGGALVVALVVPELVGAPELPRPLRPPW